MSWWLKDNMDWLVPAAIGLLVIGSCGSAVVWAEGKERDRFMAECLKERKQYECTAMWRAGNSDVTVVPVVVPMRGR